MATASELDAALLASINPRWMKVAMVFGRAERAPGLTFDEEDDIFEALADRLLGLVASGQVLAQGDLKDWRFSEVRIPTIAEARGELQQVV